MSLRDILGGQAVADYRGLGEIHHDGWGCSLLCAARDGSHPAAAAGPQPTRPGTRLYKTTIESDRDPVFESLSCEAARGALWHLRLASSHLPLIVENQQPFFANGLSFIHNGDISDDDGLNIITRRDEIVNDKVFLATGGRSDSAVFFAVILEFLGFGFSLEESVVQAVKELRGRYPKSSYNCMIQSDDLLVVLCAAGRTEVALRIIDIYDRYGRGEQAHDYRMIRYRPVHNGAGAEVGVVAASSGICESEGDGWRELANNQMLVASNRTGKYRVQSL